MLSPGRHALVLELVAADVEGLHDLLRHEVYPLGYRNARIVRLGDRPRIAPEQAGTMIEVTA